MQCCIADNSSAATGCLARFPDPRRQPLRPPSTQVAVGSQRRVGTRSQCMGHGNPIICVRYPSCCAQPSLGLRACRVAVEQIQGRRQRSGPVPRAGRHCAGGAYLQMVSPRIVERRWPTCISFATFGDEKSTTTRLFTGATTLRTPLLRMPCTCAASHVRESLMLMKPGPASLQHAACGQLPLCECKLSEQRRTRKREWQPRQWDERRSGCGAPEEHRLRHKCRGEIATRH